MYEIIFSDTAKKQLSKLDRTFQERIFSTLERIRFRPENYLIRLVGYPLYKLRVGDYRIIIELNQNKLIISILKIGHRKNVYQNL